MDPFLKDLSNFVHDFCELENRKRMINQNRYNTEREIVWLTNKIESLKLELKRKPSTIHQINNLKHQIRENELRLAFCPSHNL